MRRGIALLCIAVLAAACANSDISGPPSGAPTPSDGTPTGSGSSGGTADHAPVAVVDTFHVQRGTTLVISPPGFLANDTDADGDSLVAFPSGSGVKIAYDSVTGHVEYGGDISLWRDNRLTGVAYNWQPSGGFSFDASPDATPGVEEFIYQAYEDTPAALASEPTKIVVIVE